MASEEMLFENAIRSPMTLGSDELKQTLYKYNGQQITLGIKDLLGDF